MKRYRKITRLSGSLLDTAIAVAEGLEVARYDADGLCVVITKFGEQGYHPHYDWEIGGAILEREGIAVEPDRQGWIAHCPHPAVCSGVARGPTALVAAMRAFLTKFGEQAKL